MLCMNSRRTNYISSGDPPGDGSVISADGPGQISLRSTIISTMSSGAVNGTNCDQTLHASDAVATKNNGLNFHSETIFIGTNLSPELPIFKVRINRLPHFSLQRPILLLFKFPTKIRINHDAQRNSILPQLAN